MKLLLDQNVSPKLVNELEGLFAGISHVSFIGLEQGSDDDVWHYARNHDFIIVTHDSDFYERSLVLGLPPKIVWLRTGNVSTAYLVRLLRESHESIIKFASDETLGCLQLY